MSEVLIKGMEMPRSCADCPLTWVDDEYDKVCCITDKVVLGTIGRQDNANCTDCDCPLVEVPTPHGRLIDADALNIYDVSPQYGFYVMGVTEEDIEDAPTIIEAEGGKE